MELFEALLGNHESVPVDSFPPPSVDAAAASMSWLHDVLDEEWGPWLGQGGSHSWSVKKGAYYSLNASPGLRVIRYYSFNQLLQTFSLLCFSAV